MTKKILMITGLIIFSVLTVFAVNQFLVMTWNNSDLAELLNRQNK